MRKDCEIEINLTSQNYKYYENLGYYIPKEKYRNGYCLIKGSKIKVKVLDIPKTSRIIIPLICDNCGKEFDDAANIANHRQYDYCECCKEKILTTQIHVDNKNQRTKDEILLFIKTYIECNGTVKGIINSMPHIDSYHRKKYTIKGLVEELGLNWFDVCYYGNVEKINSKEKLDDVICNIVEYYNYLPTRKELIDLGITKFIVFKYYSSFDDMYFQLGLLDKYNKLLDKSGHKCKSSYEVIMANYFIDKDIKFKREQMPFIGYNDVNDLGHSDFTIYTPNQLHIEIWGYCDSTYHKKITDKYLKRKKEKIDLYNKLDISLLSFYPKDFYGTKKSIYEYLDGIFSQYNLIHEETKKDKLRFYNGNFSKEEYILKNLNKIFGDLPYIPSANEFENFKAIYLLKFIYANYNSIKECANAIGKMTKRDYYSKNHISFKFTPLLQPNQININN